MGFLWFDESIRDNGRFIVGALVYCDVDLSPIIQNEWKSMGLISTEFEFKSSAPKEGDKTAIEARDRLHNILRHTKVGLVICPTSDRQALGTHGVALLKQIIQKNAVPDEHHFLFMDQGIVVSAMSPIFSRSSSVLAGVGEKPIVQTLSLSLFQGHSKTVRAGEESGSRNSQIRRKLLRLHSLNSIKIEKKLPTTRRQTVSASLRRCASAPLCEEKTRD